MSESEFLIDRILPTKEIHLLAGPSGAGKTRWLMGALQRWELGLPVLGLASHPVPWAYVGSDRSLASIHRTLLDINVDPVNIKIIPAWGGDRLTLTQIFDRGEKMGSQLLVIEGFGGFPDADTSNGIRSFLNAVQSYIDRSGITIIGVVESPKMKPHERYEAPRQRVSGAAAWAHYTDTIFVIEPSDPKEPMLPDRTLFVCPRNSTGLTFQSTFTTNGRLEFGGDKISPLESSQGYGLDIGVSSPTPRPSQSKGLRSSPFKSKGVN